MILIFEFVNNQEFSVEVHGEVKELYLNIAGLKKTPEILTISRLEKRAERKHFRKHKYTGFPVSLEAVFDNGVQVVDRRDAVTQAEMEIDLEKALRGLTNIQRYCFLHVCINERTQSDVAKELGKSRSSVAQAITGARKKIKKYYQHTHNKNHLSGGYKVQDSLPK